MNLKDRLLSEITESGQSRIEEKLTDITPISRQPSKEQELLSKAQTANRDLTATVASVTSRLEAEKFRNAAAEKKISALSLQNSMLLSRAQELRSAAEQLRGELLSEQKLNLRIVKENNNLRNGRGLHALEEQEDLRRENDALKALNDKLREQINLSNVRTVLSAKKSKEGAEKRMHETEKKYKNLLERQRDTAWISFMTQILSMLCCLTRNPVFLMDIRDLAVKPLAWVCNGLGKYAEWVMDSACWEMPGKATIQIFIQVCSLALRILSVVPILAAGYVTVAAVISFVRYCRKEWCALSSRIAYCILIIMVGTPLYHILPFNPALIFCIVLFLSHVLIRSIDIKLQNDRRNGRWHYIKSL